MVLRSNLETFIEYAQQCRIRLLNQAYPSCCQQVKRIQSLRNIEFFDTSTQQPKLTHDRRVDGKNQHGPNERSDRVKG